MPTITLEPELYTRIKETARKQASSIDSVVAEAANHYLWELERQKISEEAAAYRDHHAELRQHFLGKYIAMHNGEVVDCDANVDVLWQRVRQRFGRTPIMIVLVGASPEETISRHGFRFEP